MGEQVVWDIMAVEASLAPSRPNHGSGGRKQGEATGSKFKD